MGSKKHIPVPLEPLDELFGLPMETQNSVVELPLTQLVPPENHPFKVIDDKDMYELTESIVQHGVLEPGIVRKKELGGYELISGNRRKMACQLAGIETMPVLVRELTDDEVVIVMVNSNIQREKLSISEKAKAYKMEYEALKHQGKRNDLTSSQVGNKLEGSKAAEIMAKLGNDSKSQILRYVHLMELVPGLLELADQKSISFNAAVELSYLNQDIQAVVLAYMNKTQNKISLAQVRQIRKRAVDEDITSEIVEEVCALKNVKYNNKFELPAKTLEHYFGENYTKEEAEETIIKLLEEWKNRKP